MKVVFFVSGVGTFLAGILKGLLGAETLEALVVTLFGVVFIGVASILHKLDRPVDL